MSPQCGLVHLDPRWLADRVKPIADHRLQDEAFRASLVAAWAARRRTQPRRVYAPEGAERGDGFDDDGARTSALRALACDGEASADLFKLLLWSEPPAGTANGGGRDDGDGDGGAMTFEGLLALLVDHQLLVPIDGGGGAPPTSYLLPMKLPPRPPAGFADRCALRAGEGAWECTLALRAAAFPPGLFSKTFAALRGLGPLRASYESGGVLACGSRESSTTLVFRFDLERFTLALRVHGAAEAKPALRACLEAAAAAATRVVRQFRGLVDTEPGAFEFSTAHETLNARVSRPSPRFTPRRAAAAAVAKDDDHGPPSHLAPTRRRRRRSHARGRRGGGVAPPHTARGVSRTARRADRRA